jgi:uncharacterized protein
MAGRTTTFLLLAGCLCGCAGRQEIPARPAVPVLDQAEVLSPDDEHRLAAFVVAFEQSTTVEMALVTVPSTGGQDPALFATELGQKWGVGKKGKDNGLVVLLVPGERAYFTAVGYGLEGTLPDSRVGTLQREVLVPALKQAEYGRGLRDYVHALAVEIIGAERKDGLDVPGLLGVPEGRSRSAEGPRRSGPWNGILMAVFGLLVVGSLFLPRRRRLGGPWLGGGFGGMRHGGFGGGLGGSGFGGGFGGFGGGGFGGGGSGGRW